VLIGYLLSSPDWTPVSTNWVGWNRARWTMEEGCKCHPWCCRRWALRQELNRLISQEI